MGDYYADEETAIKRWIVNNESSYGSLVAIREILRVLPELSYLFASTTKEPQGKIALMALRSIRSVGIYPYLYRDPDRSKLNEKIHRTTTEAAFFSKSFSKSFSRIPDLIYYNNYGIRNFSDVIEDIIISAASYELSESINDANLFDSNLSPISVFDQPLWKRDLPKSKSEEWKNLKQTLFSFNTEDWGVWIDWYEGRLAGFEKAPVNFALEKAILLLPNHIWEAGPKIANAEIRRLMQVHSREALDETVSPEPVIESNKITVAANATADVAGDLAAILDLPERLREAIGDLLDMLTIRSNAYTMAVPPLTRYREHLDRYGPKPMLDSLNDRHAIVKDEYTGLRREGFFDSERGLRRAFLTFFALHKRFRDAFAKDAVREAAIRMYRLDPETLDTGALDSGIDAFEQGAQDALEAGAATPEFAEYAGELSGMMRDALRTPPPGPSVEMGPDDDMGDPVPNEKLWPVRVLLKGGAFAGRLAKLLNNPLGAVGSVASIVGFLDSERGKKLMKGLRDIYEAIFGNDEDG